MAIGAFYLIKYHKHPLTKAFAAEIAGLSRILQAAISTLNDPNFPLRSDATANAASADIRRALFGAVVDIRLYLEKLRQRVQKIQGRADSKGLYRRTIQKFEMRINESGVNNMRSLLQTHQNSLNIALAMVQLHHRTHGPDYEHTDLRPEIYRLTRIVERLPTADDLQRLRDGLTADHVRELQRVAQRVVRDASQTAGSSAASELGAPLDPNTRRRIDEWIDRNAFEEHGTQVDLGQELGFNTASTYQTSGGALNHT